MKVFSSLLVSLAPLALARAPLVNRDIPHAIADNYIVVMKDADPSTIQAHYTKVHTNSSKASYGKKGLVRTYQIPGFNAYHIECDNATLETIRKSSAVSA